MYFTNCETLEINDADNLVWSWNSSLQYFFFFCYHKLYLSACSHLLLSCTNKISSPQPFTFDTA